MKAKSYFIIIILFIIITPIVLFPIFGIKRTILYPDKDAHVEEVNPDKNKGDYILLPIGYYADGSEVRVYIHFNLLKIKSGWETVKFGARFDIPDYGTISPPLKFLLYKSYQSDWDEGTLTWNNQPSLSTLITNFSISHRDELYYIKVSSFIQTEETDFTIAIIPDDYRWEIVEILSRDVNHGYYSPQLIFFYPTPFWEILFLIILGICGLSLGYFIYVKWFKIRDLK